MFLKKQRLFSFFYHLLVEYCFLLDYTIFCNTFMKILGYEECIRKKMWGGGSGAEPPPL